MIRSRVSASARLSFITRYCLASIEPFSHRLIVFWHRLPPALPLSTFSLGFGHQGSDEMIAQMN
jgi:hypothetical protein